MSDPQDRYLVPALQRGLNLLQQFTRAHPHHTSAALARQLNMPRASVFRMLHTLEQMGFVERQADGVTYRLGMGVLRLGFELITSMELVEQARPVIEALSKRTGYSAHVVLREGTEVVFVAKTLGRNALFHSIQVGARLPAHATVLGRVLLGNMALADLQVLYPSEPLPTFTPHTPTSLQQLCTLIAQDRAQGYGISQAGFESGISTIAAPVCNDQDDIVAAISITIPRPYMEAVEQAALVKQVVSASNELTQRIRHVAAAYQAAPIPDLRLTAPALKSNPPTTARA